MADLVAQLKEMQRSDSTAKEQWYAYVEQYGENVRDPAKHDSSFLNSFISQYNSGARLEYEGAAKLRSFIKQGQKKSQYWRAAWEQYCATSPEGKCDPALHELSFLEGFFDHIGKRATMGLGAMMMMHDSPDKRMRMGGQMALGMGTGDPAKDQAIAKIKAFQRQGETQKDAWHAYCDTNLAGMYDPSRHDTSVLEQFVTLQGIENIAVPAITAGGMGMGYGMGMDQKKSELVMKIKTYQKSGDTQKEGWHNYCDTDLGGVRDPARHDTAALQQFASLHGIA